MFEFEDARAECSVDDVSDRIWGASGSVRSQLEASSYGKETLHLKYLSNATLPIVGPVKLPYSWKDLSCSSGMMVSPLYPYGTVYAPANFSTKSYFPQEATVPLTALRVFVFPSEMRRKCNVGGEAYGNVLFVTNCKRTELLLHELGHLIGFDHGGEGPDDILASGYDEYADDSTVMGSGLFGFNSPEVSSLNWLPRWATASVTADPKSAKSSLQVDLAPLDTMPEDLLGSSTMLAMEIQSGCSKFQISFRSKTSVFGFPSLVDEQVAQRFDEHCVLYRVVSPSAMRNSVRTLLIKTIPHDSSYTLSTANPPITFTCGPKKPEGTVRLSVEGHIALRSGAEARPERAAVSFPASSLSCGVSIAVVSNSSLVGPNKAVGLLGIAKLMDPSCAKASVELQLKANVSYYHLSIYPPGAPFRGSKFPAVSC